MIRSIRALAWEILARHRWLVGGSVAWLLVACLVAALMLAFLEQLGNVELARRLLLLGSGYLNRSLGHSISCTAFILLEMIERNTSGGGTLQ